MWGGVKYGEINIKTKKAIGEKGETAKTKE